MKNNQSINEVTQSMRTEVRNMVYQQGMLDTVIMLETWKSIGLINSKQHLELEDIAYEEEYRLNSAEEDRLNKIEERMIKAMERLNKLTEQINKVNVLDLSTCNG